MTFRIKISLLTPVIAALAYGGPQVSTAADMGLREAVQKALAYDPSIRKVYADVIQADGFAKEMRADMRPQLSLEASAGPANRDRSIDGVATGGDTLFSRSASVVGRQLLWSNGYFMNRYKDAKQRVEARQMLEREQREITAFGVVEAFLEIISARKQLGYAEKNMVDHKRIMDLAKERAEAAGTQADVELSLARHSLSGHLVQERRLALVQAEVKFVRLVGERPPDSLLMPRAPQIESFASVDPTQNWHFKAAQKQYEAAVLERKSIRSKYAPRFYLEVRGGAGEDVYGIDGPDNSASAMLTMSWDLLDGGRRKAQMQQADADIERQEAIIHEVLVTIQQDASARWAEYKSSGQRMALLKDYESSLSKTVGLYGEQFNLGTRPLLSILDVQNETTSALVQITDEERDYAKLGYSLLFYGGKLIPYTAGAEYVATPREPDGSALARPVQASARLLGAPPTVMAKTYNPRSLGNSGTNGDQRRDQNK